MQLWHPKGLSNFSKSVSKKMLRTDIQITQRLKHYVLACATFYERRFVESVRGGC